jgi:hypothetical protein
VAITLNTLYEVKGAGKKQSEKVSKDMEKYIKQLVDALAADGVTEADIKKYEEERNAKTKPE